MEDCKQIFRERIETVFGELIKLFPKKIHAASLKGFLLKISLFSFAFQIDIAVINNKRHRLSNSFSFIQILLFCLNERDSRIVFGDYFCC